MSSRDDFDFENALRKALDAIDIGPHCSCADITMEILRVNLPLRSPEARYAAAGFGGGVGGSGGPCGAFSAGLIAYAMAVGEREEPKGCIAELVEEGAQRYFDEWMGEFGSISCAQLSGYPSLRAEAVRDEFFNSGGVERCTDKYIRFAAQKILELVPSIELGNLEGAARRGDATHVFLTNPSQGGDMQLMLSDEEVRILAETVKSRMDETLMGISRADARAFRDSLIAEGGLLEGIYAKLGCQHVEWSEAKSCDFQSR
jgi:hypothetical protein